MEVARAWTWITSPWGADQLMGSTLSKGRWARTSEDPLTTAITDYAIGEIDGAPLLVYGSNGKLHLSSFEPD